MKCNIFLPRIEVDFCDLLLVSGNLLGLFDFGSFFGSDFGSFFDDCDELDVLLELEERCLLLPLR